MYQKLRKFPLAKIELDFYLDSMCLPCNLDAVVEVSSGSKGGVTWVNSAQKP